MKPHSLRKCKSLFASLLGVLLIAMAPQAGALPDHFTYDVALGQVRKGVRRDNSADGSVFSTPGSVAIDKVHKHIYVTDSQNARVLAWKDVTSFQNGAPADLVIGQPDQYATDRFRYDDMSIATPSAVAVDSQGTLWVADYDNGRIQGFKWPFDPSQTLANNLTSDTLIGASAYIQGYPTKGCNGGYLFGGTISPPTASSFCYINGLAVDASDNLYVADTQNQRVLLFKAPIPAIGAVAAAVFGQPSMTSTGCNRSTGTASAITLCQPTAVFIQEGATPRLYIVDEGNNRVLGYDNPVTNQTASIVFGQQSMSNVIGGVGPDRLFSPNAVVVDNAGNLWVSDGRSNRVMGYAPPFDSAGTGASYVIGQLDATGNQANQGVAGKPTPLPSATTISGPHGLAIDPTGRLVVVDGANNRVLFYSEPAQMTPPATQVLGQLDFTHGAETRTKQEGLAYPVAIAVDQSGKSGGPQHVYVADMGNSRVLGWWDLGALYDGKPADLVIGQVNFANYACNRGSGVTPHTLCWPRGITVDGSGNLWVADTWNHRILRFPAPYQNTGDHQANLVLGQASFLGSLQNEDGTANATASSLDSPSALIFDGNGTLWVADRDNDRVVGFGGNGAAWQNGMAATRLILGFNLIGFNRQGCPTRPNGSYLCGPIGLALDVAGNLWIAERDNSRVILHPTVPPQGTAQIPFAPLAALGQPNFASVTANSGPPAGAITAQGLARPESVAVEIDKSGGTPAVTAIVVADTGNNRVLIYPPTTSGFQPAATKVIGQTSFNFNPPNTNGTYFETPAGVQVGLFNPAAVLALPEGLFISDSGATSTQNTRAGSAQFVGPGTGNNRVLIIKGPGYPAAGVDAAVPPVVDMLGGIGDQRGAAHDLIGHDEGDGSTNMGSGSGSGSGCSCQVGGRKQPLNPLAPLALALLAVLMGGLSRRRSRPELNEGAGVKG